MNPYEILEVQPGATSDEIKGAYHRLAKVWHPDRFPQGPAKEEAELRFRQLTEAFVMLKDSGRRAEVDAKLVVATAVPAAPAAEAGPFKDPRTKSPEDWFADAQNARLEGDLDRALGLAQYTLRMDSSRAEYHLFLADVLEARDGDKRTLVKALESALQLNAKDVDTMVRLAEVFRGLGMTARADGLLDRARSLQPKHKALRGMSPTPPPEAGAAKPREAKDATLLGRIKASFGLFSKRS